MLDAALEHNPGVRKLQSAAAGALFKIGLSANVATTLAAITGVASGIAFGRGATLAGIAMLALSAGFDALDGAIAREYATPTLLGGVFDLCSDRVVEVAVILGIVWNHPALDFYALFLVASWYINITVFLAVGAALERTGPKLIEYPPGILERTEALIFFVVLALIESSHYLFWLGPLMCLAMTALEILTGLQRF
ncbi:MAG TPA: CDP-alcohol phosphatidyltransferase family protein, partial [Candidatus Binataceae bacterium]